MPDETGRPKPTIEERLEAITQTLELVAIQNEQNTKAIGRVDAQIEKLTGIVEKLTRAMTTLAEAMADHHRRIRRLEDPQ
jgi:methyl-accepting chemotaxis protein